MVDSLVPAADHGKEFQDVLSNLQPLLGTPMSDKGRRPSGEEEDRPSHKKAKGKGVDRQQPAEPSRGTSGQTATIEALTALVVRLDRDLSLLHHQDTFLLYMTRDQRGVQVALLQEAQRWRERATQQVQVTPLRCHLASMLLQELQTRVVKISNLDQENAWKNWWNS